MDDQTKKKNVLDLQFQKYLTIASTSVIISFTYIIGVVIAIFTKQVKLNDLNNMLSFSIISMGIIGICSALFFNAIFHLKNIPKVVKNL